VGYVIIGRTYLKMGPIVCIETSVTIGRCWVTSQKTCSKKGPIGCHETSVTNKSPLGNIPEDMFKKMGSIGRHETSVNISRRWVTSQRIC